ncbi:hypothetical protein JXA70_04925, partial [candidate division KSB1 bacterium]|nr:hypothetical protein [candidate division KSB1 bacterium]
HICILLNKKKTCSSDPEIAGILTDVTNHIQEKKEHEQLRRQLAEVEKLTIVGQLALAITHEIRNSTEIIHNKLLLLKKDISFLAKSEKAILLITKIENQISQLVLVANDLLRYSKPRDKNKSLININNVIAHTLKMHFDDIERIKFQKDENIPLIKGDAIGLEIVFKNIILNALAASDNKNEIICRSIKLNQGNVKITFQDFGFGISADDLKNVFDPFFTRKYGRRGTGLGLAICKQIIEAHQGSIKIKSTAGKGTLVSILLPYQT